MSEVKSFTIGKVNINLVDCDVKTNKSQFKEDILRIVRDRNALEFPGIIEEKVEGQSEFAPMYLYHLSQIRGNIVRWLPIDKHDTVLEIGAECGAITDALVKLSENTTSIADCATDAEILANRFMDCKKYFVYGGDVKTCLGILLDKDSQYDWIILRDAHYLNEAKSLLKPYGRIVFITDNRCGMRNFAGEKAYGEAEYFTGIEGKADAGFTFAGLRKLFSMAGLDKAQMFYPYPDYRYMKMLFSNSHMPKAGELVDNIRNFNSDRLSMFSEKDAFDAACEDGSFQYYSNSYLVVLGEPVSTEYARFSNDRAPEYAIFTAIENNYGKRSVRKYPITDASASHIRNLSGYYEKLTERYSGSKLKINECKIVEKNDAVYAEFEYVEGVELSKLMDKALAKDDLELFYSLFDRYTELIGYNESSQIADLDVVFSNILINKDEWTLIDYEWCKESQVPMKETAYRAIYCYLLEDANRKKFNRDLLLQKLVLSTEAAEEIERDELIFQKRVTGRYMALDELREHLGFNVINPLKASLASKDKSGIYRFQVYPGGQTGEYSEENSYFIEDAYKSPTKAQALVAVMATDIELRIDPVNTPCIATLREVKLGELDFPFDNKKYVISNGKRVGKDTFVFSTDDPNLYFNLDGFVKGEDTFLYVDIDIIPIPADTARAISDNIKRLF